MPLRRLALAAYTPPVQPAPPFNPANISGALLFDASVADSMTFSGSNVTSWTSTNGQVTLLPVAGAGNPVYDAANKRVEFTGGWKALEADDITYSGNKAGLSIYSVGRVDTNGNSRYALITVANNFSTRFGLTYKEPTGQGTGEFSANGRRLDGGTFNVVRGGGTLTPGTYYLHGGVVNYTAQTIEVFVNGVSSAGTTADTGVTTNSTGAINLGSVTSASSANFVGAIEKVVFFDSTLATVDRQKVEGFLAWSTGRQALLPVGHPYIGAPP